MMRARSLRLGLRMLRRDLKAGEVRVLLAALVLAVCAVASVGFVTDRAGRALDMEANRLLGGDAVLRADGPIAAAPRELADRLGLRRAETVAFPSMLRVGDSLRLSDLRALSPGFPLRGQFRLALTADGTPFVAADVPERGTVWLSRAGAEALGARVGDTVQVGELPLRLAALVVQEPDAALDFLNVAPRGFFHLEDLPATALIQPGSRAGYRVVVAGEMPAVESWVAQVRAGLARGQRMETIADARPEIRSALERADRFLGLAALVAVVLAGVAVAMAARRHAEHHLDGCAVMRCLGASQRTLLAIHAGELLWLGLLGTAIGLALGWLLQAALAQWLQVRLGVQIPGSGWMPALQGAAVGFCVLIAFALPPLLALRRVSAARVLRRDLGGLEASAVVSALAGIGGLGALLWWKAGGAVLGMVVLGGLAATLAVLALLGWLLIVVTRRLRGRLRGPWRYGLANVGRRARASMVQVSALGLGLMAILLLTLVRTDLITRWQQALPDDAPNRFLVNIQSHQVDAVRERLREGGVLDADLYPMVRGRLVAVNSDAVTGATYAERGERTQRLAEREFNLSWATTLRSGDNKVVAGRFWGEQSGPEVELSVEEGIARALGWSLGDTLRFDIAGTPVEGRITSLRQVDWESFKPNFFVLMNPAALVDYPASHIGAIHVPPDNLRLTSDLVREFPNVSVIDIEAILAQVRATADRVAAAVEYVFYFTLVAGVLVLLAAVTATQDERLLEGAVMRVVGASRRQLRLAHLSEFAAFGAISGLTAAVAASAISGAVARRVLELPWQPDWRLVVAGAGLGMLLVTATGLWATRRIARVPPSVSLREL